MRQRRSPTGLTWRFKPPRWRVKTFHRWANKPANCGRNYPLPANICSPLSNRRRAQTKNYSPANEEIQSGNEELQSTNEELQTSKEELESANEELHTVNEEMQHRNELLTQLNNDLTNLLYSVSLPIVMVGADLSVRRFTPQAAAVLGLTANDIGRPMPRLRLKVDMGQLEQNMLEVIQNVQPQQLRVQDTEGRWVVLRMVPYRTMDNRIEGVVLSLMAEIDPQGAGTGGNASSGEPADLSQPAAGKAAKSSARRK